uniref:Saposin B-type domain-containing protein n=1 Tax=Hanusia phi TaxID=3032 RepID=A0A7S0I1H3_9CRYP|mmetsp:Transcript_8001/g.18249  ORF Transcript_8001/g.18249 Transcript_8001/m.18249 type:complete len:154 (+) Transcript_8001:1-462(+)
MASTKAAAVLMVMAMIGVSLSQPGMPKKLEKEHICAGCRATVTEIAKKSGPAKKRFESRVMEVMDEVCKMESFRTYDYPPPTMVQACKVFLGDHEDTVEQSILGQGSDALELLIDKVCWKQTKVCEGVDIAKQERPTVYMDGKPMNSKSEELR